MAQLYESYGDRFKRHARVAGRWAWRNREGIGRAMWHQFGPRVGSLLNRGNVNSIYWYLWFSRKA